MTVIHVRKPIVALRKYGYIGDAPLSGNLANPLLKQMQYMQHWNQNLNLFNYSAPPDEAHCDDMGTTKRGFYYIILQSPLNSAHKRYLNGVILPWRYGSIWGDGSYDQPCRAIWYPPESPSVGYDVWGPAYIEADDLSDSTMAGGEYLKSFAPLEMGGEAFQYHPTDGAFQYGILQTHGIMTAAMSIWPSPAPALSDADAVFEQQDIGPGTAIRGYDAGNEIPSLGRMMHQIGDITPTNDTVAQSIRRCLFQSGHPFGIWTDSTDFVNISGTGSYRVVRQQFTATTPHVSIQYAFVATVTGADANNRAQVRFSAARSEQTATKTITSNSTTIHSGSLTIEPDYDDITVELKASGTSEITLHSWSFWAYIPW
jgi:hypothetical protein